MDKGLLKKVLESPGTQKIQLGNALREYQRSRTPFLFDKGFLEWNELSGDFMREVDTYFPGAVQWEPTIIILDEDARNQVLPEAARVAYLKCNVCCSEYLTTKKKK